MRTNILLAALGAVLIAGCGSRSAAKAKPTPTPTRRVTYEVGTLPVPTARPGKQKNGRPVAPNRKGGPGSKIPTAKPIPTGTPLPPTAISATLFGKVIQLPSHQPLAGALIVAGVNPRQQATSDASGKYSIKYPGGMAVPVSVTKKGYAGQLAMGSIKAKHSYRLNFTLRKIGRGKPLAPPPPMLFGGSSLAPPSAPGKALPTATR